MGLVKYVIFGKDNSSLFHVDNAKKEEDALVSVLLTSSRFLITEYLPYIYIYIYIYMCVCVINDILMISDSANCFLIWYGV